MHHATGVLRDGVVWVEGLGEPQRHAHPGTLWLAKTSCRAPRDRLDAWQSRRTATGRPPKDAAIRRLVAQMANASSTRGLIGIDSSGAPRLRHHEAHLRRLLRSYLSYYHWSRTHLSLHQDARPGTSSDKFRLRR